jgi:site-specific DNA-methyltransferase (adenine-specific)
MLERVLTIASEQGDFVLDPFGGAGTTYAVAERMHRHWVGIELGDTEPIIARLKGEVYEVEAPNKGDAGKGMSRSGAAKSSPDHPSLF